MCIACSLSVLTDPDEARRLPDFVPGFRKKLIAKAQLSPQHGRILHTPSARMASHHSWWVPADLDPVLLFTLDLEA